MLYLNRIHSDLFSTRGVIVFGRNPVCHTLELPWLNNSRNISCIPDGLYTLRKIYSVRHGKCFEVLNVPDRDDILIHSGNSTGDSAGCVLVGLDVNGASVVESRLAISRLDDMLPYEVDFCVRSFK